MLDTLPPVVLSRPEAVRQRARRRRGRIVALVVAVVVGLAAVAVAAVLLLGGRGAGARGPGMPFVPFAPTAADGFIPEGEPATLDSDIPAITHLDPALRDALAAAAADAGTSANLPLDITSGWRSVAYQQYLFDEAVTTYASEEIASQYVATPEASSHVTGDAVDVGPLDLQFWLMQYGADYGLCQTYANERWHWELATTPGGVCPEMLEDASAPRG